jgi:hypothetical protein
MRINRHAFSPHLRTNRVPFDPHIYCIYQVCVTERATELIPPLTACSWVSGDASFHQMESSSWATRFLGVLTLDDSLSSTNQRPICRGVGVLTPPPVPFWTPQLSMVSTPWGVGSTPLVDVWRDFWRPDIMLILSKRMGVQLERP